MPFVKNKNVRK